MVADNNIIVVTINYRLGSLGFLAASVLTATAPNAFQNVGDAGNYESRNIVVDPGHRELLVHEAGR